jgi:hypothetical protein
MDLVRRVHASRARDCKWEILWTKYIVIELEGCLTFITTFEGRIRCRDNNSDPFNSVLISKGISILLMFSYLLFNDADSIKTT